MSAQPLEVRMAHLEGACEQVSQRLTGIDQRLAGIELKIEQRFAAMDQKFLWVIGLVLVSIILPFVGRLVPHG